MKLDKMEEQYVEFIKSTRKNCRRDSYTESLTYIVFMDNLPNVEKLYFKIGKTISLDWRLRQLKTANPFLGTIGTIPFDCEKYLHRNLKSHNVKKEWFCIKDVRSAKEVLKTLSPLIIAYHKDYFDAE